MKDIKNVIKNMTNWIKSESTVRLTIDDHTNDYINEYGKLRVIIVGEEYVAEDEYVAAYYPNPKSEEHYEIVFCFSTREGLTIRMVFYDDKGHKSHSWLPSQSLCDGNMSDINHILLEGIYDNRIPHYMEDVYDSFNEKVGV